MNILFSKKMELHSSDDPHEGGNPSAELVKKASEPTPESGSQKKSQPVLARALQVLIRCRGREIPGIFNSSLVAHLFWEQSEPWKEISREHTIGVSNQCKHFMYSILDHISAPDVKERLLSFVVLPALDSTREGAFAELKKIFQDMERHPMTYNHYFTDTWQKIQLQRLDTHIKDLASASTVDVTEYNKAKNTYEIKRFINPTTFQGKLDLPIEQNMDKYSAQQALDVLDAVLKGERKYFIDVVAKQVIERHLMAPLVNIFSPTVLARYTDEEVGSLASEPPEAVSRRQYLEGKMKMLQESQEAFRAQKALFRTT